MFPFLEPANPFMFSPKMSPTSNNASLNPSAKKNFLKIIGYLFSILTSLIKMHSTKFLILFLWLKINLKTLLRLSCFEQKSNLLRYYLTFNVLLTFKSIKFCNNYKKIFSSILLSFLIKNITSKFFKKLISSSLNSFL